MASEVRALIAGLVIVSCAGLGAVLWHRQHPGSIDVARLVSPTPAPPVTPKPTAAAEPTAPPAPPPTEAKAPEAAKPAEPQPKTADLGVAPPAPKPPEPAAGAGEPPHFDVVRVEPTGETVLAGKGDPNAKVQLLASGKVVAEATADANGHFVILPPTLAPGSHDLSLRQSEEGKPTTESTQSVAVSVPAKSDGKVVVAMAEPGKPTKLIAGPPETPAVPASPPAAASPPEPKVAVAKPETAVTPPAAVKPAGHDLAIRSVELENGNGFFASGAAAPGTRVTIYLNGAHLAEVVAGPDGQWSVTIRKGLAGGHYAVRADAGGDGGTVAARAEVPFDVPVAMAQAPKPAEAAKVAAAAPAPEPPSAPNPSEVAGLGPEPSTAKAEAHPGSAAPQTADAPPKPAEVAAAPSAPAANAVIDQVETTTVVLGDNLWNISRARLGHGRRFTEVYAANQTQIRDPKLIYPGQVFVVPAK